MKEDVRDKEEAMAIFFRNCPEREFKRIIKYLYELTYFSIPDYNFIYYCIQHACKSNNIKPTDPLDWDMSHEFAGPTGPPGDGKMSDMKLDEHEEDFDGGKNVATKHAGNSESAGRKNSKTRSTRNDAKNDKSLMKQTSRKITAPVG
ncbi:hypothetical protein ANCCAN_04405 [Ancylostoma caninum]|uniref:Uncharacterized protein n=1 Tax=Ancylostoma caninum TaxID=29170 RepID=A0A368GYQ5_ANCCA|nr:hypothetical protein ANCCAN_04405 [Ancylostoma caninum]